MFFTCFFGKHRLGLPRMNAEGVVEMECVQCLHRVRSSIVFPPDADAATALNARRALAIAELVDQNAWVGLASTSPSMPAADQRSAFGRSR